MMFWGETYICYYSCFISHIVFFSYGGIVPANALDGPMVSGSWQSVSLCLGQCVPACCSADVHCSQKVGFTAGGWTRSIHREAMLYH